MTRVNQGLFSTTMEAEKRDPGNEVVGIFALSVVTTSSPVAPFVMRWKSGRVAIPALLTKTIAAYGNEIAVVRESLIFEAVL